MSGLRPLAYFAVLLARCAGAAHATEAERFDLVRGDVVAFVGGESVVRQGEGGHLESLLAATFPGRGVRFRNLGWEGDTVFEQPRDVNYPSLAAQVKRVGATVVFAEFGAAESLAGPAGVEAFEAAYGRLLDALIKQAPRVVLVTPPRFEKPANALFPDLSARNGDLRRYVEATLSLARKRNLRCADLFHTAGVADRDRRLTDDGMRLTPRGAGYVAGVVAASLGVTDLPTALEKDGRWSDAGLEAVRRAVVAKSRLWFDYSRPTNWAFLGGDRTSVPSSRDPDDLTVRIFPRELERFVPLIERADVEVERLARARGQAK